MDVTRAVCGQINKERDGELVNRSLLKTVIGVFDAMGEGTQEAYEEDFQRALLRSSEAYYNAKAAGWIATDDVPTYLNRVRRVGVEGWGGVGGVRSGVNWLLRAMSLQLTLVHPPFHRALTRRRRSGCWRRAGGATTCCWR